ncbi:MAG: molybdenum cofactor guanylyltransferase [Thermoanaerobaculia bacterium]
MALITEMSGVVLAGGESARMGRDKAWLDYGGRPLIEHQLGTLSRVFDDVRVSAKEAARFSALAFPVIKDSAGVSAPIAGIAECLRFLRRPIFVLAVDLPKFPEALVREISRRLLDGEAACVALRAGGRVQGLAAAYRPSALPVLERNVAAGRLAVHDLVAECGGVVEGEDVWSRIAGPEAFSNWNRPEDVSRPGG